MRKFLLVLVVVLSLGLIGCSSENDVSNENVSQTNESETETNLNTSKEEDKIAQGAAFAGFRTEIGDLQDRVHVAMSNEKAKEVLKGKTRTNTQLYNYVARGGEYVLTSDEIGDSKWLKNIDSETVPCTQIDPEHAVNVLGMDLPNRKVNTSKGENEQVSYFVTPKGVVFCWPPFEYEGKSYVSADTDVTAKDPNGNEMANGQATKENQVTIYFEETNETVIVSNEANQKPTVYENGSGNANGIGVWYPEAGTILGIDFSQYNNSEKED